MKDVWTVSVEFTNAMSELLHDMKQPLNLIKVIAQDVRLDVRKNRLQLDTLSDSMTEIEETIDKVISQIENLRQQVEKG